MDRVIALIDMDCFYVQVEQRAAPEWIGKPCVVVQYKTYKGGGIIAVNYEAKAMGVKRRTMGQDAIQACPSVHLFRVPETRGKADLTRYREAGAEVIRILVDSHVGCVERASVDEAFIDLTDEVGRRLHSFSSSDQFPNTIVVGYDATESKSSVCNWLSHINDDSNGEYDGDRALAVGAAIVEELRAAIFEKAGFRCSAGVAHNKVLAKLACGINKPNKQTVLPKSAIHHVFTKTPLGDVRGFGGKFGELVTEKLHVEFMADLCQFTEMELLAKFGERGSWIYNICHGIDYEPVMSRQIVQSIACSKNFQRQDKLTTIEKNYFTKYDLEVRHWLSEFSREACERLIKDREKNNRIAKTMSVSVTYESFPVPQSATRSYPISRYDADKLAADAWTLIQQFNTAPAAQQAWSPPVLHLGLSAGKFVNLGSTKEGSIHKFFSASNQDSGASKAGSSAAETTTFESSEPEEDENESTTFVNNAEENSRLQDCFKQTSHQAPNNDVASPPTTLSQIKSLPSAVSGVTYTHLSENRDQKSVGQISQKIWPFDKFFKTAKPVTGEAVSTPDSGESRKSVGWSGSSKPCEGLHPGKQTESTEVVDLQLELNSIPKEITNNDCLIVSDVRRPVINSNRNCLPEKLEDGSKSLDCSASESSFVSDVVQCEHCGVDVSPWELPEHLDWHVAVDLQKDEQTLSSTSRPNTKSSSNKKNCSKTIGAKKRQSSSEAKSCSGGKKTKSSSEGVKKISTFFTPGSV